MQKREYKSGRHDLEGLQKLGDDGWGLVALVADPRSAPILYLKRPKQ